MKRVSTITQKLLVFLLVILLSSLANAETIAKKIKTIPQGSDSAFVTKTLGSPTEKQVVSRYFYQGNQAVFIDSVIRDIRLAEPHKN